MDIQKCKHGVYLETKAAVKTGKAFYCWMCRPEFCLGARFGTPNISLIPAHVPSDASKLSCPRCGALSHYEAKHSGLWDCAECGNSWKKPRADKYLPALVNMRTIHV